MFALAYPDPEADPEVARDHARVVAAGRSDEPAQINNVLALPGVFRGALDAGVGQITDAMKRAAARAIAEIVTDEELQPNCSIPSVLNPTVAPAVAAEVQSSVEAD